MTISNSGMHDTLTISKYTGADHPANESHSPKLLLLKNGLFYFGCFSLYDGGAGVCVCVFP